MTTRRTSAAAALAWNGRLELLENNLDEMVSIMQTNKTEPQVVSVIMEAVARTIPMTHHMSLEEVHTVARMALSLDEQAPAGNSRLQQVETQLDELMETMRIRKMEPQLAEYIRAKVSRVALITYDMSDPEIHSAIRMTRFKGHPAP
jgi:hypothetical protein